MGILKNYFSQTRKPEGVLGKMMLAGMNGGHAKLADWGMSYLVGLKPHDMADFGCGGGRNAGELLRRYPGAVITAIDYSDLSVEKAKAYNAAAIKSGKCTVAQGDVSALPFEDESFDLVTAFETVYFWPGIEKCFAEVARVLRPGGTFLICNESDGTDSASLKFEKIIDGMTCYTSERLVEALTAAGFSEATTDHHDSKPWITVVAKK